MVRLPFIKSSKDVEFPLIEVANYYWFDDAKVRAFLVLSYFGKDKVALPIFDTGSLTAYCKPNGFDEPICHIRWKPDMSDIIDALNNGFNSIRFAYDLKSNFKTPYYSGVADSYRVVSRNDDQFNDLLNSMRVSYKHHFKVPKPLKDGVSQDGVKKDAREKAIAEGRYTKKSNSTSTNTVDAEITLGGNVAFRRNLDLCYNKKVGYLPLLLSYYKDVADFNIPKYNEGDIVKIPGLRLYDNRPMEDSFYRIVKLASKSRKCFAVLSLHFEDSTGGILLNNDDVVYVRSVEGGDKHVLFSDLEYLSEQSWLKQYPDSPDKVLTVVSDILMLIKVGDLIKKIKLPVGTKLIVLADQFV